MAQIDVRHLEMVEAIARAGTVTAAAARLHITQPGLSHALGELEHRLGVKLFRRERRQMVPTRGGERLLETARVVLAEMARAEHDLAGHGAGLRGALRLTTECYTCYHWLPAIIRRFGDAFPEVDVQLVPEATRRPFAALLAHELDLAITHSSVPDRALADRVLFEDELVAVMSPAHPLAARRRLGARDFAGTTLILHQDPARSILVTDVLVPAGIRPQRVTVLQLTEAVLEAVKARLGITVMARWAVAPEVARGGLVTARIGRSGLRRIWRAAFRRDEANRPALEAMVAMLRRETMAGTPDDSAPAVRAG